MGFIRKVSDKKRQENLKKKEDKERMLEFFLEIWKDSKHQCQSCGKYLGKEPKTIYFDHLLEKNKYPELGLEKENIYICCMECHEKKTNGFPTENHKKAIELAKIKFKK